MIKEKNERGDDMATYQKKSGFLFFAQWGFFLILMTFLGIVLKPFFPDAWVEQIAGWIHSDFETLANLAINGLSVLACLGLGLCSISILFHD